MSRAGNETLGVSDSYSFAFWLIRFLKIYQFEKILVVGLKERTDRRDVIALQSSLTGLHVDWVDGVKGADVFDVALPPVSSAPRSFSTLRS